MSLSTSTVNALLLLLVSTAGSTHAHLSKPRMRPFILAYKSRHFKSADTDNQKEDHTEITQHTKCTRRTLFKTFPAGTFTAAIATFSGNKRAKAGMVMFPPESLNNRYFLMRAGEDELLARDEIMTNKVYTNVFDHGLTKNGKRQVVSAYEKLSEMTSTEDDIVLWPSIQFNAYQSATILSQLIGLSQNRIVPEYTFLDPRGMGTFEGGPFSKYEFVHKRDQEEGILYKPPKNDDGTDNESVNDVFIRVRQAMSITETQYSGRTVIFISPDSDNLSVLEAALRAKVATFHDIGLMQH